MSNLSEERKFMVTGSNAFRVMAGFESELNKYEFEPFDNWELVTTMVGDGITDIKTLKEHVKDITAEKRDRVLKLIRSNKPFELSKGMETYAMEIAKASFVIEEEGDGYKSKAMEDGNINEIDAVIAAEKHLGVEFEFTLDEQEFFKIHNIGLTPDGMLLNELFMPKEGLEVKYPTQDIQFFNAVYIKSQDDLLEHYPNYYWQCMTGLAVTKADKWHWLSHNPGLDERVNLTYIQVDPVKDHIDILLKRSGMVMDRVEEIVRSLHE
jgi:hypothetical protein